MMASAQSYYDILGVPRTASLDEIKKRYRELARQHHPDMNRDKPDAAKRFAEITTAYKTLSHPDDRATYDADLALQERRAATSAARAAGSTFPGTSAGATTSTATGAHRRPSPTARRTAASAAEVARLVDEAQAALTRMRFVEALELCRQALHHDPRNARAFEIKGDVYRHQNRINDAIHMYTMSLQFNPRNTTVQQRMERLARMDTPAAGRGEERRAPIDSRTGTGTHPRLGDSALHSDKRAILNLLLRLLGGGLAVFLIYSVWQNPGEPLGDVFPPISTWSAKLIVVMGALGLLLGFTLAATDAVRRIEDELILAGAQSGRASIPLGILLVLVSMFSFYLAALFYTVVGVLQESFTQSMALIFGAVLLVVFLLTAVYAPGQAQVFWFGGNVVFLSLLIGWFVGDLFRPESW